MSHRRPAPPSPAAEWHTGLAPTYPFIDEKVAAELEVTPADGGFTSRAYRDLGGRSVLAETAALARVADHLVAEIVAHARRNGATWAQIGAELGVTRQAAQMRYGKIPLPPSGVEHTDDDCFSVHLTRDRTRWGCLCGAAGSLS